MNRSVETSQLEPKEIPAMISTPALSEPMAASAMPAVPENAVRDLVQVFRMLADETRMRILFFLSRAGELHVRALCELLGQSQPAVSHHLALMKHDELIELRREGKHNFYRIVPQRFEQALGLLFDNVPSEDRRIRFEDHVLSYDSK